MSIRNKKGQFVRTINEWLFENFDEGFSVNLNGKERFKVYKPDHPRAVQGYVLRSITAYEHYHNTMVPKNKEIHHINENTLDDSKENLLMVTNSEHQKIHSRRRGSRLKMTCKYCDKVFEIPKYRLNDKTSQNRGTYCSQKCYHKDRIGKPRPLNAGRKKGPRFKVLCRKCGKEFYVKKSLFDNPKTAIYCSRKCMYESRKNQKGGK